MGAFDRHFFKILDTNSVILSNALIVTVSVSVKVSILNLQVVNRCQTFGHLPSN